MAEVTFRAATAADAGALAAVARIALLDALAVSGPVPGQAVLRAGARRWERPPAALRTAPVYWPVPAGASLAAATAAGGPAAAMARRRWSSKGWRSIRCIRTRGSAVRCSCCCWRDLIPPPGCVCGRLCPPQARPAKRFLSVLKAPASTAAQSRILPPPALDLWFEWPSLDGFQRRLDAALDRRLRAAGAFPFTGSREDP